MQSGKIEKGVPENYTKFTVKYLCWSGLYEKDSEAGVFLLIPRKV